MAKIIAVTNAFRTLTEVENCFQLSRNEAADFFPEWQQTLPSLNSIEQERLRILGQRPLYHRAEGDLLEGAVMLRVASPLLELAEVYDPSFRLKTEVSVEIAIEDGIVPPPNPSLGC